MKNLSNYILTITTLVILSLTISSCSTKSIAPYLDNEGVKTLASLAHPSSTMKNYDFKEKGENVNIYINYTNGHKINIKLKHNGNEINQINVVSDTDWWDAFTATEIIKNMIILSTENKDQEEVNDLVTRFENRYKKNILQLSGKEISMFIMTLNLNDFNA